MTDDTEMTEAVDAQPEQAAATPAPKDDEVTPSEALEIFRTVFWALLIALVFRVILFQPFTIPSSSMKPNLLIGDYLVVSKFSYGYSSASVPFVPLVGEGRLFERPPQPGDIIVFKTPAAGHKDLVKRLIGLPGDRIQMKEGDLYVNGEALKRVADGYGESAACPNAATPVRYLETNTVGRTYVTYDCGRGDLDDTEVFVVPEGHYFFMGDNRDNSLDSRVIPEIGGVGYVPASNLIGKAETVMVSWNENARLWKPWTWLDLRWTRLFHSLKR